MFDIVFLLFFIQIMAQPVSEISEVEGLSEDYWWASPEEPKNIQARISQIRGPKNLFPFSVVNSKSRLRVPLPKQFQDHELNRQVFPKIKFIVLPPLDPQQAIPLLLSDANILETRFVFDIRQNPKKTELLIRDINKLGFCSIDTEGKPATLLQIGTPKGCVGFFSPKVIDQNNGPTTLEWDLPDSILTMLKDPFVVKLQSNVGEDVKLLREFDVEVNGWCELQNLWRFCSLADKEKLGIQSIAAACKLPIRRYDYRLMRSSLGWTERPIRPISQFQHAVQDVRVPIVGFHHTLQTSFPYTKNLAPYTTYLLSLLTENSSNPQKFIEPSNGTMGHFSYYHNGLYSTPQTMYLMDTSPYIVLAKDFDLPPNLQPPHDPIVTETVFELVKTFWSSRKVPSITCAHSSLIFKGCRFCYQEGTCHPDCDKTKFCQYPFCCNQDSHAVLTCPILHAECHSCQRRGHYSKHHEQYDPLLLDYTLYRWAPFGLWTSLNFLLKYPFFTKNLTGQITRFLPSNRGITLSQRALAILELPFIAPDEKGCVPNISNRTKKRSAVSQSGPVSKRICAESSPMDVGDLALVEEHILPLFVQENLSTSHELLATPQPNIPTLDLMEEIDLILGADECLDFLM